MYVRIPITRQTEIMIGYATQKRKVRHDEK